MTFVAEIIDKGYPLPFRLALVICVRAVGKKFGRCSFFWEPEREREEEREECTERERERILHTGIQEQELLPRSLARVKRE